MLTWGTIMWDFLKYVGSSVVASGLLLAGSLYLFRDSLKAKLQKLIADHQAELDRGTHKANTTYARVDAKKGAAVDEVALAYREWMRTVPQPLLLPADYAPAEVLRKFLSLAHRKMINDIAEFAGVLTKNEHHLSPEIAKLVRDEIDAAWKEIPATASRLFNASQKPDAEMVAEVKTAIEGFKPLIKRLQENEKGVVDALRKFNAAT